MMSPLLKFAEKYIDRFPFKFISESVPLEIIEKFPEKPWKWKGVSIREDLPLSFVNKFMGKLYYVPEICLRIRDFDENFIVEGGDWDFISLNKNLTVSFILNNLEFFNWEILSKNEIITWDVIMEHPLLLNFISWKTFSENPMLDEKTLENNFNFFKERLDWGRVANVSPEFLMKNLELPFNYSLLIKNERLASLINTEKRFLGEYLWEWDIIVYCQFLTEDFIRENMEFLDASILSKNKSLTLKLILEFPEKKWDINRILIFNPTLGN